MRIVDGHVHVMGEADPAEVLKRMDAHGVARMIVLSTTERVSLSGTRANLEATRRIFEAAPDRLTGLAWVNPAIEGVADLTAEALSDMGYAGVKIIPDHWFAHEERLEPFWERMNDLAAPILFHTGILYGYDDASRFCKPVYLEKLLHYPKIRFAMAHISWPWCEECLAVMGRFRAASGDRPWQSYVDLTPGTPKHIRKQAVANAIDFCGPDHIMFGTDNTIPGDMKNQGERVQEYLGILDEIGLDEAQKERVMSGTADELFPPRV